MRNRIRLDVNGPGGTEAEILYSKKSAVLHVTDLIALAAGRKTDTLLEFHVEWVVSRRC